MPIHKNISSMDTEFSDNDLNLDRLAGIAISFDLEIRISFDEVTDLSFL